MTAVEDRALARSATHQIEAAVATIAHWSIRNDIEQETMRRAKCSLPRGAVWLLAWLARSGPARLSDAATALGVDKSTLSPQAKRLERHGLLTRVADPSDGRAALLHVTRAGHGQLTRLHSTRRAIFDELLADWTPHERAEAATILTRLAQQLTDDPTRHTNTG